MARQTTDIGNISARLAIADAVLEAVRGSKLLRAKRRAQKTRRRKTTKAAAKTRTRRSPLANVPAAVNE